MSNISRYTHNVNFLSDQYNVMNQCYNNQEGMKLLLNQQNNRQGGEYSDKKIYVGDVALSDDSPVTITQVCCNNFKPATNDDEIAIDGQKTRKPRTVINEKWSAEEDARLAKAVKEHGAKNWKNIAKIVGGSRTDVQCLHRWRKVISPELVKGPWTPEEDKIIIEEVEKVPSLANVKWSEIAQRLHGRIGKQCRERYLNYLDSSIKRSEWTEEEDRVLFEIQRVIGNRWCEIAKVLPGRSENNVKNRYNSKMRNVYLTKYPTQMIPPSIIIEQQIEDPIHGSKKRRILCPAVKNLLKYLDLSKEYIDNLNSFSNMKNNGRELNGNSNISLSIQPSTTSSSLIISNTNNNNNNNTILDKSGNVVVMNNNYNSLQIKQEQFQQTSSSSFIPSQSQVPQKRQYKDSSNNEKCKKQKLEGDTINIIDYSDNSQNDKQSITSKPKVTKQYQLRKRRKNGKNDVVNTENEEKEEKVIEKEGGMIDFKSNNNNNLINSITSSPRVNYSDDSLLLSGMVDEEEAYKNFVETIPDNNLKYFNNNNNTNSNNDNNSNSNNNNNINSINSYSISSGNSCCSSINNSSILDSCFNNNNNNNSDNNNSICISNNFSDSPLIEDELNSSCLDCFQ